MKRIFVILLFSTIAWLANGAALEPAIDPTLSFGTHLQQEIRQLRLQFISGMFPKTVEFLVRCNGDRLRKEIPTYGSEWHSLAICDKTSTLIISPYRSKYVSDCSVQGKTIVWDLKKNEPLRHVTDLPRQLSSIHVTPDGHQVIAESADSHARIWDIKGNHEPYDLGLVDDNVPYSCEGPWVAKCNVYKVNLWDVETGQLKCQIALPEIFTFVSCIAISPDGTKLAVGKDGLIGIFSVPAGKMLVQIKHGYPHISSLDFSRDGAQLAGSLYDWSNPDRIIYGKGVWSVSTGDQLSKEDYGECRKLFVGNKREECNPLAPYIHFRSATIFDNETGQLLCSTETHEYGSALSDHWYVATGQDNKVYAYDLDKLSEFQYLLATLSDRQLSLINQIRYQAEKQKKFVLDITNRKLAKVIDDYDSLPPEIKELVQDYVVDTNPQLPFIKVLEDYILNANV